jgi:transcriptional regulator with XRE-family HTH domain
MGKIDINIGYRIRTLRESSKHSREKFAEMSDISPDFLFDIENAKRDFSTNTLIKICRALNTSSDHILFGIENKNNQITFLLEQMDNNQMQLISDVLKVITAKKGKDSKKRK